MSDLSNPIFTDETKAREWLEARIWRNGRFCPRCGSVEQSTPMRGKTTRPGLYQCNACREPFTVTVGTLYERSHLPLHKWLAATHLLMSSKKGISASQVSRLLGISYKSTWFMMHRVRESLRQINPGQLGGAGKFVEADETYVGGKETNKHERKRHPWKNQSPKEAAFALVERGGKVRSFHVGKVSGKTIGPILKEQLDKQSLVMTDESPIYNRTHKHFAAHETVNHSIKEYVRDGHFHTNSVENYFSILKRGVIGTYHHISPQHLKRYLVEFDYRYNERKALGVDDATRMSKSIGGIVGKRLTYRRINGQA